MKDVSRKTVIALGVAATLTTSGCTLAGPPQQAPSSVPATINGSPSDMAIPTETVTVSPSGTATRSSTASPSGTSTNASGSPSPSSSASVSEPATSTASPTGTEGVVQQPVEMSDTEKAALAFNLFLSNLKVEWSSSPISGFQQGTEQRVMWPESFRFVSESISDEDAKRLTEHLIEQYRNGEVAITYNPQDAKQEEDRVVFDLQKLRGSTLGAELPKSGGTVTMKSEGDGWKIVEISPEVATPAQ